jgi:NTP pyrophosphatase (non-canonical NTP hydrolase)
MSALADLRKTIAALRAPGGCPWDQEQTHASLTRCLIDEVSELLDTIDRLDFSHMREELGDVLMQVVFHAQRAEEAGLFDLEAVAAGVEAIGLPDGARGADRALDAHFAAQRVRLGDGDLAVAVDELALVEVVAVGVPRFPAARAVLVERELVERHRAAARVALVGDAARRHVLELGHAARGGDQDVDERCGRRGGRGPRAGRGAAVSAASTAFGPCSDADAARGDVGSGGDSRDASAVGDGAAEKHVLWAAERAAAAERIVRSIERFWPRLAE